MQRKQWETFQGIDFADRNGDGSSDAAMLFELDGQQVLMVWFWDAETETFVFRPEESLVEDFAGGDTAHQGLDGTWYLEGENFTPYSKATVKGKILETEYLNGHLLRVIDDKLIQEVDEVSDIKISQVEKYKEVLSVTE